MGGDPIREAGRGAGAEVLHQRAQHLAVARQVVAGDDRQRCVDAGGAARLQTAHELSDRRARGAARQIRRHVGVARVEVSRGVRW